jgi:hypothetical protein
MGGKERTIGREGRTIGREGRTVGGKGRIIGRERRGNRKRLGGSWEEMGADHRRRASRQSEEIARALADLVGGMSEVDTKWSRWKGKRSSGVTDSDRSAEAIQNVNFL